MSIYGVILEGFSVGWGPGYEPARIAVKNGLFEEWMIFDLFCPLVSKAGVRVGVQELGDARDGVVGHVLKTVLNPP